MWLGLVFAATLMKLTASTDDVVWLLPFVSGDRKRRSVPFYLICMQLVVAISMGFSEGGAAMLERIMGDGDSDWPLGKILELMSAVLLSVYTVKLFREWWLERHADEEDSALEPDSMEAPTSNNVLDDYSPTDAVSFELASAELGGSSELPPSRHSSEAVVQENLQKAGFGRDGSNRAYSRLREFTRSCLSSLLPIIWYQPSVKQTSNLNKAAVLPRPIGTTSAAPQDAQSASPSPSHAQTKEPATANSDLAESPERTQTQIVTSAAEKFTLRRLLTISMLGSLDDFAVFVSLLLAGVLRIWQLCLGVFLGSLIVVVVCVGAGRFNCVVRLVERIPLWCIIGAFSIWTYISTFALH